MSQVKSKPEILLTKGLPASGKSTYAKSLCEKSGGKWKRVNKDDLRDMSDSGKFSKEREKQILNARDALIKLHIDSGYNVIVDDTNLSDSHLNRIRSIFGAIANVRVDDSFMEVPLEVCLERDSKRENPVGRKVIESMYRRFIMPPTNEYYQNNETLTDAYIVDIDGTIADMEGIRHPYDWDKVQLDAPVLTVIKTVNKLFDSGSKIILLSGRDGAAYEGTLKWLEFHEVRFDRLYMRSEGDQRKDRIIKRELFDKHVRNKFNVLGVFDDRDQVVSMWREMGLTCFQVNYGAF